MNRNISFLISFIFIFLYVCDYHCDTKSINFKTRIISSIVSISLFSQPQISLSSQEDPYTIGSFVNIYNELVKLDQNWDEIVKGQGDNVRRVLGTVYKPPLCESPLCNYQGLIKNYARNHGDELDLDEYIEKSQELLEALNQADYLAYSALFSEYGNGSGGKDYVQDSRKQVKKAIKATDEVIKIIENK